MCGIAGIINFNQEKVDPVLIKKMMEVMNHRGPDDSGTFIDANIGLGFVRLSILDLSTSGHQPMVSGDERYVIVFNGEVYNYLELKNELSKKYSFKNQTDTEVVLYSYIEWGEECLHHFNGMFAFVIVDKLSGKIFGARDRFGMKPFYYFLNEKQFVFASDIPPILNVSDYKVYANDSVIFNYLLTNRTNYSEETFFEGIKKIQPGHKFCINKDEVIIQKWYDINNFINNKGFENETEYYHAFKKSIELQLRSDVPIGICLSGGLDSSAITSVLLEDLKINNLHSYSVIYEKGDIGDEQEFINVFKGKNLQMHFTKPKADDLLNELNNYIDALSEPVPGTSEFAEFKVMQLAKEHSTVILNGQGADEVLGGYDYFYAAYLKELIGKLKFYSFLYNCYFLFQHKKLFKTIKYLLFFQVPISIQCFLFKKQSGVIKNEFYFKFKKDAEVLLKKFYYFKTLKEFYVNHFKYKFEHHLLWSDKSGMYNSLETRFPFIDHNLIEKTLSTADSTILNKGWTKKFLRDSLSNVLDDKIRLRKDKIGFETPEKEWFKEVSFQKFIYDIIDSESFNSRKYFDGNKVKRLYEKHLKNKGNFANTIWKAIHLELWLRKFIDKVVVKHVNCNNSYVIITPVKNEELHIKETLNSVVNQSVLPNKWIIVDDGSTDSTAKIVSEYCKDYNWIELIQINNKSEVRMGGSKVVKAFYYGFRHINMADFEYVVKLDGDLILPKDYFEKILLEFNSDQKLGICGGYIINKYSDGDLQKEKSDKIYVRGALKMLRKQCWNEIGGFKKIWNWDGFDIMEARFKGWDTKSIDLPVIHLRPTTSAYNLIDHSYKSGYQSYKMGADWFLTFIRSLFKIRSKPFLKVGIAYLRGYNDARKKRESLIISKALAEFINRTHYKRFNIFNK